MMKVILNRDIKGLGKEKDIIDVSDGYARNFLIPKGFALKSTPANFKIVAEGKRRELKLKEKEKEIFLELARKIEEISCTIAAKAGVDGKLYGSVTSQDIYEALVKEGIKMDKKKIGLEEPIKNLGIYQVGIELHPEVKATLKVWVIEG